MPSSCVIAKRAKEIRIKEEYGISLPDFDPNDYIDLPDSITVDDIGDIINDYIDSIYPDATDENNGTREPSLDDNFGCEMTVIENTTYTFCNMTIVEDDSINF